MEVFIQQSSSSFMKFLQSVTVTVNSYKTKHNYKILQIKKVDLPRNGLQDGTLGKLDMAPPALIPHSKTTTQQCLVQRVTIYQTRAIELGSIGVRQEFVYRDDVAYTIRTKPAYKLAQCKHDGQKIFLSAVVVKETVVCVCVRPSKYSFSLRVSKHKGEGLLTKRFLFLVR